MGEFPFQPAPLAASPGFILAPPLAQPAIPWGSPPLALGPMQAVSGLAEGAYTREAVQAARAIAAEPATFSFDGPLSVKKVSLRIGLWQDTAVYEVRGAALGEVARALDIITVRDSAAGPHHKVEELDLGETASVSIVRPLHVPTGVVVRFYNEYYGWGPFGIVWGFFMAERAGGRILVTDTIKGSPIYRAGHHFFSSGVQAITRALERVTGRRKGGIAARRDAME